MQSSGTLYIVATPIGNLGDFSSRANDILRQVNVICAEDTRHSGQLLARLGIRTPLIALHDHNERAVADDLVARLLSGESLAVISDAGTPLISDPGYRLVKAAREAGLRVSPIPGPCAAIAALSVAGLPSDRFVFEGFLPAKSAARNDRLQQLRFEARTLVFYEAAHRIEDTLTAMATVFGDDRNAIVARELTKLFETVLDGSLAALRDTVARTPEHRKGEFVLVVKGAEMALDQCLIFGRQIYEKLTVHLPPSTAARLASEISGAPRKALYGREGSTLP